MSNAPDIDDLDSASYLRSTMDPNRRVMMKWTNESLEVVHCLLDANPDAFDPRADLERLIPNRCPECGSTNTTDADDEGLIDCFDCGIWFDPLHPANSPSVPGNSPPRQTESLEDEIGDIRAYILANGLPPRIRITYNRITPESAEQGDFIESGWEDEEGVSTAPDKFDEEEGLTAADLAVKYLRNEGAYETSSSAFHPGVWYSTGWRTIDYGTGEQVERNFHLAGFTEEQEREVWDKFHQRQ